MDYLFLFIGICMIIWGYIAPYLAFVVYYKHVRENHEGFNDEESLEEAMVFGMGFMFIAFIPIGILVVIEEIKILFF